MISNIICLSMYDELSLRHWIFGISILSHHCGDCWRMMFTINVVAFYLTAPILSSAKRTNVVVSWSFKKNELLITPVNKSIKTHFAFQSSVLSWLTNGVRIFCSITYDENFFVKISKFFNTPTAKSFDFRNVKIIGRSSSLIREAVITSTRGMIFYDADILT